MVLSRLVPFVVGLVEVLVAGRILWWYTTHEVVALSTEEKGAEDLGENVCRIQFCGNTFKMDKVLFNPLTQDVVLNVNVASARGRFPCVGHTRASIIVFVRNSGRLLWDSKIPKNTAAEEEEAARFWWTFWGLPTWAPPF